jgi:uncharacterized membrane protein YhaH (DUF805 family)
MLASLRHNLAGLLRFSGRTSPGQFWPYAILLFLLGGAVTTVMIFRLMGDMFARMQRFAAEHPELVTETRGPGSYSMEIEGFHPELIPDFAGFMIVIGVVAAAMVLLQAASVARRLHDRGKAGWWALLPVPFLAFGFVGGTHLFASVGRIAESGQPGDFDAALFFGLILNNFIYLGTLAFLVFLLAGKSAAGPNRYGEQPL